MKKAWLIFGIIMILLFIVAAFFYMSLVTPKSGNFANLTNPAENLNIDEIKQQFDSTFIYYLLASIKAYNLHNPPLSSNQPKIEIVIGNDAYSAVIDSGKILVDKRKIDNPDIRITTSLDEAAKMVKYSNYVKTSFEEGKSSIELITGKTELFSKGYLNLYTELTGKSITGNVIRIYAD